MAAGQREVAGQPTAKGVILLGQQPDVVAQIKQPAEKLAGLGAPAHPAEASGQPERARQVRALAGREALHTAKQVGRVPPQQAVFAQFTCDRIDGSRDPLDQWQGGNR